MKKHLKFMLFLEIIVLILWVGIGVVSLLTNNFLSEFNYFIILAIISIIVSGAYLFTDVCIIPLAKIFGIIDEDKEQKG